MKNEYNTIRYLQCDLITTQFTVEHFSHREDFKLTSSSPRHNHTVEGVGEERKTR